jgi:hypothetical protein
VVEEIENELLVYDRKTKRAHCLSAQAARVWRACDGNTDVDALANTLGVARDTVVRAIEELEHEELLESHILQIVNGNGKGKGGGITRRELGSRGAKVGGAVIGAPLILSITAPTAMAATSPTPYQCQLYTVQSCGTSTGCGSVFGCCCCCQGGGACKVCSAVDFCNAGLQTCAPLTTFAICSNVGSGPASPAGCCGVTGSMLCGCGWGTGGGCCDATTGVTCTPGAANCVPCCGNQILLPGSQLNCCTNGTCVTKAPGT